MGRQIGVIQDEKDVKEFLEFIQSRSMVKEERRKQSDTS
jgi:hypothetical protein